jgi:hypothetical protein
MAVFKRPPKKAKKSKKAAPGLLSVLKGMRDRKVAAGIKDLKHRKVLNGLKSQLR